MKYYVAQHRGSLNDCLRTEKRITKYEADFLIQKGIFKYYGYDIRINAERYLIDRRFECREDFKNFFDLSIINEIIEKYDDYDWLNIYF